MRILIIYPGDCFSTYDVAHGYDKALRALGQEVRTFNYHNALEYFGMANLAWKEKHPDANIKQNEHFIKASEYALIEAMKFRPDVVLLMTAIAFHSDAATMLWALGIPLAVVLSESPYMDDIQASVITKSRAVAAFTNDLDSVELLFEEGGGARVAYLPHSFSPERHHRLSVGPEYQTDVFFHGTLWDERKRCFAPLAGKPGVHINGLDPDETDVDTALDSVVRDDELVRFYNGTKIALNGHRDGAAGGYSLGPRAYEIAACGAFQLCDARPELADVFGDSVPTYDGPDDLVNKVDYYLCRDAERGERARDAFERVQDCTFEQRAEEILIPILQEAI